MKRISAIFLAAALCVVAILFVFLPTDAHSAEADFILYENNAVKAVLVVRDRADLTDAEYRYIADSAALIEKHFRDATGQTLPQYTESEFRASPDAERFAGKIKIHLGWNGLNPHPDLAQTLIDLNAEAANDGNHGYVFAPYADGIAIQSPTPLGIRYGAAAFLRKYLDVEWLMPGSYGADTPAWDKIAIPPALVSSAPAFNMRYGYCERTPVDWLLNQGLQLYDHTKMGNFSHALHLYFDPAKYFDEHPEYYPVRDGAHYRPTDEIAWQPRFSEPGTVDVAASEIIALLRDDPNLLCVPLGVNDSGGYCEEELAEQQAIHGLNSEGIVHMTDLYCKWCNAVIEKVLAEFPGRDIRFGMIAYRYTNDPPKEPGLKFHESMIPYITKDRSAWVDPGQEAQGHRITLDWLEKCAQLGWYNYEYGSVYLVPRIYTATMGEYMRFAKESGVKYLFSEALFSFAEGAKPHLFAMLNWDPECPLRELESRWYKKAVGPQAAPHLAAFYRVWEEIWAKDIPQGEWFNDCKNFTYLHFGYLDYIKGIPLHKLAAARRHLDRAWEEALKSGNADQKKRMAAIRRLYDLQEATVLAYPRSYGDLNQAEALAILSDGFLDRQQRIREEALSAYSDLLNEIDPLINRPTAYFEEALSEAGAFQSPFGAIVDHIERNESNGGPVTNRVLALAGTCTPSYGRQFCRLIVSRFRGENLMRDPSFEEGPFGELGQTGDAWIPQIPDDGTLERIEDPAFARTGIRSVKAEHHWSLGAATQSVPVRPGLIAFRAHYYASPESEPDAVVRLKVDLLDAEGNLLDADYALGAPCELFESPGEWRAAEAIFEVPETRWGKRVAFVKIWAMQELQNAVPMYWDDAEAYQAPDTERLDALMAEIAPLGNNPLYTAESRNNLHAALDAVKTRLGEHYMELAPSDMDDMCSLLQDAKDGLEARPLECVETERLEIEDARARAVYALEAKGALTLLEAEIGYADRLPEPDWALGCMPIENQSYPEDAAAYNALDITEYFRHQFRHKYLSFRLSSACEGGNNFYLHSHKVAGCAPRIVLKKDDGTELILNATNGLEVRTEDPNTNYNDIEAYDWRYTLFDASHNTGYNSVLYLVFDLTQYPEADALDPEEIASANLELSVFFGASSPYVRSLIRVTGLYDHPGNARWTPETIAWNTQPEIVPNTYDDPGVLFRVYGDGALLYEGAVRGDRDQAAQRLRIDVTGIKELVLETENRSPFFDRRASWGNARLLHYAEPPK
ncbi:MAG: DUF4838 domain-containing protein [Christensenellales bacterium]|jgi:hypothetical protein